MPMSLGAARKTPALRIFLALLALATASLAVAAPAQATTPGGVTSTSPELEEAPTETGPPGKATLVNGRAIPPVNAPPAVKQVIAAANKIRTKPYIYGGGHARWWDSGSGCTAAA